jgi:hypothetical protein
VRPCRRDGIPADGQRRCNCGGCHSDGRLGNFGFDLDLREIITTRNDAAKVGISANLCRRNVVVRDGPEGFTTLKLDMSAISQKLLVGRAQLWSTEANCFVYSAVLVDSLSEVVMAEGPFFMNGVTKGSLRLHGPAAAGGSSLVARIAGVLKLKLNLDGDDYVVDVECVRAPELPRGAGLLLSATAAAQLGIISLPLSARGCCVDELPELECRVDLQKLRDRGLLGADETTFDALDISPTDARLASTMMDDERDDDEGIGLPPDVVDAAMCVISRGSNCVWAVHGDKITVGQARAVRRELEVRHW